MHSNPVEKCLTTLSLMFTSAINDVNQMICMMSQVLLRLIHIITTYTLRCWVKIYMAWTPTQFQIRYPWEQIATKTKQLPAEDWDDSDADAFCSSICASNSNIDKVKATSISEFILSEREIELASTDWFRELLLCWWLLGTRSLLCFTVNCKDW